MATTIQARIIVKKNELPRLVATIQQMAVEGTQQYAASTLLPQAQSNQAPHIDTGSLNETGRSDNTGDGALVVFSGGAATGWTGLPRVYAKYHEEGTRFTGTYPFLVPAVDQTFDQVGEIVAARIIAAIG